METTKRKKQTTENFIKDVRRKTRRVFSSEQKIQIVSVVYLLGRETTIEPNQLLIYTYSDGAKEKKFINE
jgi:mRNA-degrading endonuclease YafQ of YafQ-DinJ toxin-antitoxin module